MDGDILHPLAKMEWKTCPGCELDNSIFINNSVVLLDTLYLEVLDWRNLDHKIYATSKDYNSWEIFDPPQNLICFTLTTYLSKLVALGGKFKKGNISNLVWVCEDRKDWQPSLPPTPTFRSFPLAVNTGPTPECLILAGGEGHPESELAGVEVLVEKQWFTVKCTPPNPRHIAFHNGNFYYLSSQLPEGELDNTYNVTYCKLATLLDTCTSRGGRSEAVSPSESEKLWKIAGSPFCKHNAVSFGQQLIGNEFGMLDTKKIHAFCPNVVSGAKRHSGTWPWVYVTDLPGAFIMQSVISAREMAVIIRRPGRLPELMRGSITKSKYDVDGRFSMSALCRLESAGIPVITRLSKDLTLLVDTAKIPREKLEQIKLTEFVPPYPGRQYGYLDLAIKLWETGQFPYPPTWRSLYQVLSKLKLTELSQQIEDYLSSTVSLRQMCTAVITSALLEQRSLEPDQLRAELPDYVPTRDKRLIIEKYKTLTHHQD